MPLPGTAPVPSSATRRCPTLTPRPAAPRPLVRRDAPGGPDGPHPRRRTRPGDPTTTVAPASQIDPDGDGLRADRRARGRSSGGGRRPAGLGASDPAGHRIRRAIAEGARLEQGDHLTLCPSDQPPAWAHDDPTTMPSRFELLVVGGPDAGLARPPRGRRRLRGRPRSRPAPSRSPTTRRHGATCTSASAATTSRSPTSAPPTAPWSTAASSSGTQPLLPGQLVEVGTTLFAVEVVDPLAVVRQAQITYRDGHLDFNRPPRVQRPCRPISVRLPTPPTAPGKRKLPAAWRPCVPVLMGGVMAIFVGPVMLLFCLMGPVMMVGSVWEDRRSGHKAYREAKETLRRGDGRPRHRPSPPVHDEHGPGPPGRGAEPGPPARPSPTTARPELWERRPTDRRLPDGAGRHLRPAHQASASRRRYTEFPDEHLQAQVDAVVAEHQVDPAVPVDLDLRGRRRPRRRRAGRARATRCCAG